MKVLKSKIKFCFLICCLTFLLLALIGCNTSVTISLDKTQLTINAGETYTFMATVSDDSNVEWLSSDTNVLTVSNGVAVGIKAGTATVTAQVKGKKATCNVTVNPSDVPIFVKTIVNGIENDVFDVYDGDSLLIDMKLFNGATLINANFKIESDNTNVILVENNTIKAVGEGSANVICKAEYEGVTYKKQIVINVFKKLYITTNVSNLNLSLSTAVGEYVNEFDISPKVFDKGQIVENAQIDYSFDVDGIVEVFDGVITSVKKGQTRVVISYTKDEYTVETYVDVTVHTEQVNLENEILFSAFDTAENYLIDGKLVDGNILKVIMAKQNGATQTTSTLKLSKAQYTTGYYDICIETDVATYFGKVIIADKVIYTKEELKNWPYYIRPSNWTNNGACEYSGFVVLGTDIEYTESDKAYYNELMDYKHGISNSGLVAYFSTNSARTSLDKFDGAITLTDGYAPVFTGIFDGLGHCIKGIKFAYASVGFFGSTCNGTVKNLAIKDIQIIKSKSGAFAYYFGGTAENIYLDGTLGETSIRTGLLAGECQAGKFPTLKNVVGILYGEYTQGWNGILIGDIKNETVERIKNVYGIGKLYTITAYTALRLENYATVNDFVEAKLDLSDFNEYWEIVNGVPIFKSAKS